jgi:oligopeptide transport system permease protein
MFGPSFAPHHYATVYSEYVKVPASLEPYPASRTASRRRGGAVARARLDIGSDRARRRRRPHRGHVSGREIDPRVTRYLDRSDLFLEHPGRRAVRRWHGAVVVMEATCNACLSSSAPTPTGATCSRAPDLGRISLMIGALATCVALFVGVLYGATAGFLGGRIDLAS